MVRRNAGGYNLRSLIRNTASGAVGAYRAYRAYNQRSKGRRSSGKQTSTGFLTNQYDVKLQYRRRRMPRRKRRAWVRKIKQHNAIANKRLGSQYQILRSLHGVAIANNNQNVWSAGVYGENGTQVTAGDFGIDDLFNLNGLTGDSQTINVYNLKSAVLDVEITNIGVGDFLSELTVDCYEIICRKDHVSQGGGGSASVGPADMFAKTVANQNTLGTNSALQSTLPGVTPFQSSIFCQHYKILKKTRVLLSSGQSTHFMFRDARDRKYKFTNNTRPIASRGMYHGFLFIIQGTTNASTYAHPCEFAATISRYYDYCTSEVNSVLAGYTNT